MQIHEIVVGPLKTNCYIVTSDMNHAVIIDPGFDAEKIAAKVNELGAKPKFMLLTHGHFDHILALDDVREHYEVKACIGTNEKQVITSPELNLTGGFLGEAISMEADIYLNDGDELTIAGMKVKAIEVPGHTPGGTCYYFVDENVLFSGDTLFAGSVGRTDFPGGSGRALFLGIKDKLYALPDEVRVFPGHGDDTTIGYEKIHNPFVQA